MAGMMITLIERPAGDRTTETTSPRPLRSGRRPAGTHDRDGRHRPAGDGPLQRLLEPHPARAASHAAPPDAR